MRIEDLLEFEGLTADHVRAWLQRKGFTLHEVRSGRQCWVRGTEAVTDDTLTTSGTLVYLASVVADCSMQSLLSEINPRMRPGWPTDEEIEAHEKRGGLWICDYGRGPCFGRFAEGERFEGNTLEMSRDALERLGAKFWPCDAHGNKVSRGTR